MDKERIKKVIHELLIAIGENPEREGLKETPDRVARMYEEILSGYKEDAQSLLKVLKGENFDEIVLVKDIPFYSLCEHHLLPFHGKAHVGYIPQDNRITGISKLVRVVEVFSKRLQLQERLTTQIAEAIEKSIRPKGVIVIIEAEHLCMTMRGVKKPGSKVKTSVVRGIFRENEKTRLEALNLIGV
ncbi:GTP cyclohydrolase I FolE [Candidatus Calescamantes bacterium]|nr:GTP cyclohydrolase I FolE [Candidatus Calescamantes bacterium]